MYFVDTEHQWAFNELKVKCKVEGDSERLAALYCLTSTHHLRKNIDKLFLKGKTSYYPSADAVEEMYGIDKVMVQLACNLYNYGYKEITPYDFTRLNPETLEAAFQAIKILKGWI